MNTPLHPPLEGHTRANGLHPAQPALPEAALGVSKDVAEGVPAAVRPDTQQGDGRYPIAWLRVTAPTSWCRIALGHAWCRCGFERSAKGKSDVLRLIETHAAHRDVCPLRTPQEGRTAA
ncbi:hypothetical protein QFZ67_003496 [Streptomyces sp. V1I1]|nr:hypothetical protein [Streptomyces sp. V1I1]